MLGRRWLGPALVFAVTAPIYVATRARGVVNVDAYVNSLTAWQLARTGRPYMDTVAIPPNMSNFFFDAANGHLVTARTPAQILLAVPFYLSSSARQADFTVAPGGMCAAVLTALALALFFSAIRARLGSGRAFASTLVLGLTTPVWTVSADALWTHPVTVLGLCGSAWAAARDRWLLAGAWLGLAMLARPHVAVVAAALGLGLAIARRTVVPAIAIAVPTLCALVLLATWNGVVLGSWGVSSGYAQGLGDVVPGGGDVATPGYLVNLAGFLVAPDRGLFVWTPLVLVLVPALVRSWGDLPDWSKALGVGGVLYLLVQCSLNVFGGSDAFFGYRLMLEPLVAAAPAFAFAAPDMGPRARAVLPLVIGYQAAVMACGAFVAVSVNWHDVWTDNSILALVRAYPVAAPVLLLTIGLAVGLGVRRTLTASPVDSVVRV